MSSYQARLAERNKAYAELAHLRQELRLANENNTKSADEKQALKAQIDLLLGSAKLHATDEADNDEKSSVVSATLKVPIWELPPNHVLAKELICYDPSTKLGDGSSGTSVHLGYFGSRKCAIKKMNQGCSHEAKREVEALLKIDHHSNVVSYYHMEENVDFIFIALELCEGSLDSLIKSNVPIPFVVKVNIVQQAICGLQYLHRQHMSHRDIKPANVLYITAPDGSMVVKLADLGFARQLESSTQGASIVSRSHGWQPPEVLDLFDAAMRGVKAKPVLPKPADVFSMGLLIFVLFSDNHVHPFGGGIKLEPNILDNNRVNLGKKLVPPEVENLVVGMITFIPERRLRLSDCLLHPALWTSEKKLEFLKITSDALQHTITSNTAGTNTSAAGFVSDFRSAVLYHGWKNSVDGRLLMLRKSVANYADTLDGLLRLIRNKEHHFDELPADLQAQMGNSKLGVLAYFLDSHRFPSLLVDVFKIVAQWYCVPSTANVDSAYLKLPAHSNAAINLSSVNDYLGGFSIHFILHNQNALP